MNGSENGLGNGSGNAVGNGSRNVLGELGNGPWVVAWGMMQFFHLTHG